MVKHQVNDNSNHSLVLCQWTGIFISM